jgi:hypothetical protein
MTVPIHLRLPPLSPSLGQYIHLLGYFFILPLLKELYIQNNKYN